MHNLGKDINSKSFKLRKIINGIELEYSHSFLTYSDALIYAKENYINGGLEAKVIKSGGASVLYDVYAEKPPKNKK